MKTTELSKVAAKAINYKPATEKDAAVKEQIRKPLVNVVVGEKMYQIELWYVHPTPVGAIPSVMVTVHKGGKPIDIMHLGHTATTIGQAVEMLEKVGLESASVDDLPAPVVAESCDQVQAEKIRAALLANSGKLLTELSQTNLLPPHYRRSPRPLLNDIESALPLVDANGITVLVVGSYYIYLLESDKTSEFVHSDNEHVFDLGNGIFIGVVQV